MSETPENPTYEEREIRCPRLGGPVTFGYCRIEGGDKPCPRAIKCWGVFFDAQAFFRQTLTPEQFAECFLKPPPSKIDTLMEMIDRAKKVAEESRDDESEESDEPESP